MSLFLRKSAILNCLNHNLHLPKIHFPGLNLCSPASTIASKPCSETANHDSFAVNYLINVHGFSRASALRASKVVHIKSSVNPDAVVALFKSFGLNDSYISSIFRKRPIFVQFTTENLLQKIEFFKSLGFRNSDIPRVLASGDLLLASLKTRIIPIYDFLNRLLASDDLLKCITGYPTILTSSVLADNVEILRHAGVPERNIAFMVRRNPRAILVSPGRFREAVTRVEEIGFNPLTRSFVKGVWALNLSKLIWEEKMKEYKRWGMSEDEVVASFRKYPWCMLMSVDKIRRVFELLVNEIGCSCSVVISRPAIVSLSIEKKLVPRCEVYRSLMSKDLVKGSCLGSMLVCTEQTFLKKYVDAYKEAAPELLKLYHEKMGLPKKGNRVNSQG
ncbi:hypothetical protein OROGR_020022 [Orobanche gracilis]